MGIALGAVVHFDDLRQVRAGRVEFLASQAQRFDHRLTQAALSPFGTIFAGIAMVVAFIAAYEGLAAVIARLLRWIGDDPDGR